MRPKSERMAARVAASSAQGEPGLRAKPQGAQSAATCNDSPRFFHVLSTRKLRARFKESPFGAEREFKPLQSTGLRIGFFQKQSPIVLKSLKRLVYDTLSQINRVPHTKTLAQTAPPCGASSGRGQGAAAVAPQKCASRYARPSSSSVWCAFLRDSHTRAGPHLETEKGSKAPSFSCWGHTRHFFEKRKTALDTWTQDKKQCSRERERERDALCAFRDSALQSASRAARTVPLASALKVSPQPPLVTPRAPPPRTSHSRRVAAREPTAFSHDVAIE